MFCFAEILLYIIGYGYHCHTFKRFAKVLENKKHSKVMSIQSDHGGEFQNEKFEHFYEKCGIKHNFSGPRMNRSLEELSRTMLNENSLPKYFLG